LSELSEGHKLNNICTHVSPVPLTKQGGFISIKLVHGAKICGPNSNNYDGKRKIRAAYDLVDSLLHVVNYSISDDHQNVVFLVYLIHFHVLSHIINKFKDSREVGWTVKRYPLYRILVRLNHAFYTITFWVENVPVKSEAVISCLVVRRNCGAESECGDLFVVVIVLKDTSHRLYRI